MKVREALEKKVGDTLCGRCRCDPCRACVAHEVKLHFVEGLAPIIERALRAAWERGYEDCLGHELGGGRIGYPENGVTAGVAAMVEES